MRRYFTRLHGNDTVKKRLGAAILSESLNHALLIAGPDGSGKNTLATEIAAALNCEKKGDQVSPLPCGTCNTCRRIYEENYTDIKRLKRDSSKATIGVEELRLFREDMFLSATESDYKIYIIEDADKMTPNAQNALLKVLEAYLSVYDEARGIERVEAITVLPLSEEQKKKLTLKLEKKTGKTIVITNTVDTSILGGIKLRYMGIQLDASLKTRLDGFEKMLTDTII